MTFKDFVEYTTDLVYKMYGKYKYTLYYSDIRNEQHVELEIEFPGILDMEGVKEMGRVYLDTRFGDEYKSYSFMKYEVEKINYGKN